MSLEIHVLSNRQLHSTAEWQTAIEAEGFRLNLSTEGELTEANVFFPAVLNDTKSGFELYHDEARELTTNYAAYGVKIEGNWRHALSFRWGSLDHEGISAFMAATAYARATDGVVFDPQDGRVMSPDESREIAKKWEKQI